MNIKKVLLIALLAIALVGLVFIFIKSQEVKQTTVIGNGIGPDQQLQGSAKPHSPSSMNNPTTAHQNPATLLDINTRPVTDDPSMPDLKGRRDKNPDGVIYTTLNNTTLDKNEKQFLEKRLNNLQRYGSFSGGRKTDEFSHLDKKHAMLKQDKPLSFKPTEIAALIPDLTLTGKWYSGGVSADGYSSLYRLYESPQSNQKFEITEMYLDPKSNATVEVLKESLNYNINNVPMTLETIKDDNGNEIYSVHYVVNQRYYSLSTQNMSKADLDKLLQTLAKPSY